MSTLLARLLTLTGIRYTQAHITRICAHDDGSLPFFRYAIAAFRTESLAVELSTEQLDEIPLPALALLNEGRMQFWSILEKIENNDFQIYENQKTKTVSREDFCKRWTGKALLIEKNENSGEAKYIENRSKERRHNNDLRYKKALLFGFPLLLFAHLALTQGNNAPALVLFLLSFLGFLLSGLLLLGENDEKNDFFRAACALSSSSSCTETVQKRKAFFYTGYTWAEAAFAYFLFFVLSFLFASDALSAASGYVFLQILSFLGVLAGVYSLYVQKYEQKKWCALCSALVVILFLSPLPAFFSENLALPPKVFSAYYPIFLSGLSVYFALWAVRFYFSEKQEKKQKNERLTAFLHDEEAFLAALSRSPSVPTSETPDDFVFGNAESNFEIIMVSRPSCKPCQAAHREIEDITANFGAWLSVQICYSFPPDKNHPDSLYVDNLLREKGLNTPQTERSMQKHSDFCHAADISYTPTFIINGHILPASYRLSDVPFFAVNA
jgi:hypothetical protein